MELGQILLKKRWISPSQWQETLNLQKDRGCSLDEILLQQGFVAGDRLEQARKEQEWREKGFWVID